MVPDGQYLQLQGSFRQCEAEAKTSTVKRTCKNEYIALSAGAKINFKQHNINYDKNLCNKKQ
jgi:hypothetical protein